MTIDWTFQLYEQLDWQWREHMRPRWDGLTDEEYFWEPVPGMWNVRPRGTSKAPIAAGSGDFTCDYAWPEPDPAPVTTIAWRLAHLQIGIFGQSAHRQFEHRIAAQAVGVVAVLVAIRDREDGVESTSANVRRVRMYGDLVGEKQLNSVPQRGTCAIPK